MADPVLVLLNGVPGSGKSTLARAWTRRHDDPLAMALDVDVVRGMLGRWSDDALPAGRAARAMAVAAIGVHLGAGHDVIVPQYLRRADFLDELADAAHRAGARFVECALVVDAAVAAERLRSRAAGSAVPGPEGRLEEPVAAVHEEFGRFLAGRPAAIVLRDPSVEELDGAVATARSASSG
ncbi:AAA family ATPase [Amnibacterium endophyticum]|uniref:AAA family ATPase n=1 Tax=Amnibacterium endophyticum TaxID=2109337 RepID=A0ABW4LIF3_9MICO